MCGPGSVVQGEHDGGQYEELCVDFGGLMKGSERGGLGCMRCERVCV